MRPSPGIGRLLSCLAQLLERLLLDLSDPLGREPEAGADLAQRLRGLSEPVVTPQHRALALVEPVSEIPHLLDLHVVQHLLVPLFGVRVGDCLTERRCGALVGVQRLLEAARRAVDCQQAVELCAREPRRGGELRQRRFSAVGLQVIALGGPDLGEAADGVVGEGRRPCQLRDQLLHGLADPEGRVAPERRLHARVVALGGEEQPGHPRLHQLAALHSPTGVEATGDAADRRQERIDELLARRPVSALGRHDQLPLPLRGQSRAARVKPPGIRRSSRSWRTASGQSAP
ncbi:MAG: hypothetical protein JWO02_381 [Solirubrobacterales bacterium]|nr:hypothetical protein [Solirubrobacterales bacterium]